MYVVKIFSQFFILEQIKTHNNTFITNTDITGAKDFDAIGIEYVVKIEFDGIEIE